MSDGSKVECDTSFGILDATKTFVFTLSLDVYPNQNLCSLCNELLLLETKDIWLYLKFVPP